MKDTEGAWAFLPSLEGPDSVVGRLAVELRGLTDKQRAVLFSPYCPSCGEYDADSWIKCQCENDE